MSSEDSDTRTLAEQLQVAQRAIEMMLQQMNKAWTEAGVDDPAVEGLFTELQSRVEEQTRVVSKVQTSYQELFDSLPDVLLTLGPDHCVRLCNRSAVQILDRTAEEILGKRISGLFEPSSGEALLEICQSGFEGDGESEVSLIDGRTMGFSINRVDDQQLQLVLREVSPMQLLRTEVANTRRMASVGQLAGGIAHEINNPLAVIQGRIEMLRAVADMPPVMRERQLDVLEEHCRRVARVVQNLHTFARPRSPDPVWTDVAELLDSALDRVGRRLGRVTVEQSIESGLQVYADVEQLHQVLVNLVTIAIDTSPDGGKIRLQARGADDASVRIELVDEGDGLEEEILAELRAPYVSGSVPIDAGRGLALSTSWAILQDHGGWMTAEDREPRGTAIELQLPGPDQGVAQDEGRGVPQVWSVLVVDDDRIMCETVAWMLTTDGHRVAIAHSAEQALEEVERGDFDHVLTDLRLPGMDGEALIDALSVRWPDLAERTVLTSGLLYRPRNTRRYLQKPFTRAQLLKILRDAPP